MIREQAHRVAGLQVVGQDEDGDRWVVPSDCLGRNDAFLGVGRRHLDVDDGDVGLVPRNERQKPVGRVSMADNLDTRVAKETREPLAQKRLVFCDHDAHGISTTSSIRPDVASDLLSTPSTAPTRSPRSTRTSSGMVGDSTTSVSAPGVAGRHAR